MICILFQNNRVHYEVLRTKASDRSRGDEKCDLDCGFQGHCENGQCLCSAGWSGAKCDQKLCDPRCKDNGQCRNGTCLCIQGWNGKHCTLDNNLLDLQSHVPNQKSSPNTVWWSSPKDLFPVGNEGRLIGQGVSRGKVCQAGLPGTDVLREVKLCPSFDFPYSKFLYITALPAPVPQHLLARFDVTFIRSIPGISSELSSAALIRTRRRRLLAPQQQLFAKKGCPKNCNNHGECVTGEDEEWMCFCDQHWDGQDCSVPLERKCDDNIDNDNDGLIDCSDSECCLAEKCRNHTLCLKSADPLDILLRKQPPAITASFFERMQFLIEEESLRNGSPRKIAINGSRTSVIRGQVVGPSGSGIVGVRVGIDPSSKTGSILTQESGW
ncbi:teneurin-m [Trichonephila clavipes]|nr:teneurin-m [Trichonephila clavipes]